MYVLYILYVTYRRRMTTEIPVTEARAKFSDLINRVGYGGERIVLTRHGKPLVALLPAADLDDVATEQMAVLDVSSRPDRARSAYDIAAQDQSHPQT